MSQRVKKWLKRIGIVLAISVLALTLLNASWLAPTPSGQAKLLAHRGVYQLYDRTGLERDTCTADRIEQPQHDYLENTPRSVAKAARLGANMIEVDIAPTQDGKIAIFHDWTVDCRTDGEGDTRDYTLAELQALDAGYGYTADGGQTHPFRGKFVGAIPALADVIAAAGRKELLFNFKSRNVKEADMLAAALVASGRDPATSGDAFYGYPPTVARMMEHAPGAWGFSKQGVKDCTKAYLAIGWSGYMPSSCENGTMFVPINRQWAYWGWPNRLIARMEAVGGRVVVVGPIGVDSAPVGLTLPEELGEIPASFNGYIWVDDVWNIAPAKFPSLDDRTNAERTAAAAALERRRAARRRSRD